MGVEFQEENQGFAPRAERASGLTGWIIKKGWAKDEVGANKVLLGAAIVCVILTIIVIVI